MRNIDWKILKTNLFGSPSDNERVIYEKWLKNNPSNKIYVEKILKYYENNNLEIDFSEDYLEDKFNTTFSNTNNRKRKYMYYYISSAAAVIIFLFYLYFTQPDIISDNNLKNHLVAKVDTTDITILTSKGDIFNFDSLRSLKVVDLDKKLITYDNNSNVVEDSIVYHTIKVPKGKTWSIILADGTRVDINSNTELTYPTRFIEGKDRYLSVKGEAFFKVKNNKTGFIVDLYGYRVKVYGTQFNVNTYDINNIKAVLLEGSLSIKDIDDNKEIFIKPNQMAVCSNNIELSDVNAYDYISWKDGLLVFNELELKEITDILMNVYNVNIIIKNKNINTTRIYYNAPKTDNIITVLDAISRIGKISYSINNGDIIIQ